MTGTTGRAAWAGPEQIIEQDRFPAGRASAASGRGGSGERAAR
ncbi:hypothetical protein [Streptomyces sp. WMMB 714]|nr:hypothetical protein [Streptomyces sp. WMMB 714]